ncbi:MAG: periplasmic heavy metal sensor [Desulfobacterales bacterium]|nr:periplasmic heavy metal sensor [Desulfobacterales bacterium]
MKKVTIFTLICLIAASGIGLAKESRGVGRLKMPHGKWWRMPEVAKKLALTSEEQQKFEDLFVQSRRRMIDFKSNVEKERLELEMILDQQDLNESACMDRFKKFEDARTNLANERFRFLVEVRKLLGLERYRKLKTEFRDHRVHRMKGRQERKGPVKETMVHERFPSKNK